MTTGTLAEQLSEVALRLQRRLRQEEGVHGQTGARLATLRRLMEEGPLPVGELAAREGVAAATMTRMVDSLEAGKLVVRRRTNRDGRVVEVIPTSLGRSLVIGAHRYRLRWIEGLLGGLSNEDLTAVNRTVQIIGDRIQEQGRGRDGIG
jgi:DNA-binding MarR family transcriptional regulator